MNLTATYYAIFYDNNLPKTTAYAMYKRIPESQFINLLDGFGTKEVVLRQSEDAEMIKYRIVDHRTFNVFNTIENSMYAVFDCERVKAQKDIFK